MEKGHTGIPAAGQKEKNMALTVFTRKRGEKGPGKEYVIPMGEINRAIGKASKLLETGSNEGLSASQGCERALKAASAILEVLLPPLESAQRLLDTARRRRTPGEPETAARVREKIRIALAALTEAQRACRDPEEDPSNDADRKERPLPPDPPGPRGESEERTDRVRRTLEEVAFHTNLLHLNAHMAEGEGMAGEGAR